VFSPQRKISPTPITRKIRNHPSAVIVSSQTHHRKRHKTCNGTRKGASHAVLLSPPGKVQTKTDDESIYPL
jgi:hypothetical protein